MSSCRIKLPTVRRIESDIVAAIEFAQDTFGPLSIFVNNAGIAGCGGSMDDMDSAGFDRTLRINLTSTFIGTKYAAR